MLSKIFVIFELVKNFMMPKKVSPCNCNNFKSNFIFSRYLVDNYYLYELWVNPNSEIYSNSFVYGRVTLARAFALGKR